MALSPATNPNPSFQLCCKSQKCPPLWPACPPSPILPQNTQALPSTPNSTDPNFTILIITILGILATAFLLVSYYALVAKCCSRWDMNLRRRRAAQQQQQHHPYWVAEQGLDESVILSIPMIKYTKSEGDIAGDNASEKNVDCSVCLSEFCEDESLRKLPKCSHIFHMECIDSWLRTHSSCPLCRTNVLLSVACASCSCDAEHRNNLSNSGVNEDIGERITNNTEVLPSSSAHDLSLDGPAGPRHCRAMSDLVDPYRRSNAMKKHGLLPPQLETEFPGDEEEGSSFQAVRRSFSMDSCPYRDFNFSVHVQSHVQNGNGSERMLNHSSRSSDRVSNNSRRGGFLFFGRGHSNRNSILPI